MIPYIYHIHNYVRDMYVHVKLQIAALTQRLLTLTLSQEVLMLKAFFIFVK